MKIYVCFVALFTYVNACHLAGYAGNGYGYGHASSGDSGHVQTIRVIKEHGGHNGHGDSGHIKTIRVIQEHAHGGDAAGHHSDGSHVQTIRVIKEHVGGDGHAVDGDTGPVHIIRVITQLPEEHHGGDLGGGASGGEVHTIRLMKQHAAPSRGFGGDNGCGHGGGHSDNAKIIKVITSTAGGSVGGYRGSADSNSWSKK